MVGDKNTVLLGIDPGTNLLGYGLIEIIGGKARMLALGVVDLRKIGDGYEKLSYIYERVCGLIASFQPAEMAIESPFYGKNVQSMLKLGRAQGVAIAAAMKNKISVHEYAPRKIKMALTGNGAASKEQVACLLQKILKIKEEEMGSYLDATDALAAAYCHFLQRNQIVTTAGYNGWSDFVKRNACRVSSRKMPAAKEGEHNE